MQPLLNITLLTLSIRTSEDVVKARQRARQISSLLGFDIQGQTRVATAVSEMARNAHHYGMQGKVEYGVKQSAKDIRLIMRISDQGPGISAEQLSSLLADVPLPATQQSSIQGTRRIMDYFYLTSTLGKGTVVEMAMILPLSAQPVTQQTVATIANALARYRPDNALEEVQQQNHELLYALELLNKARDELEMRVQERTQQLSQSNQELQQEVAEHTHTLTSLKSVSERLQLALKAAQAGTWCWNVHTGEVIMDDFLPPLFGLSRGLHQVNIEQDILLIHADDRARVRQAFNITDPQNFKNFDIEFKVVWPDQSVHTLVARGEAHFANYHSADCIIGICWDVTERRQIKERLRQHQQELAQMARLSSMGEMGSALAHELNQPLTAITSFTQGCIRRMESEAYEPQKILQAMKIVAEQSERAGAIIHRMKDFVRRGKIAGDLLSINELIKSAITLIQYELPHCTVDFQLEPLQTSLLITADRIQIEQVLINLLRNAIEAMTSASIKEPAIMINARIIKDVFIELNVIDNGPGFPLETLAKLLEPYFTTKSQGMGMGLSISRTIIETWGGQLNPKINPTGGAWFQIILPAA